MGAGASSMAKGDIAYLQHCTHFSLDELEELYRRFERLDRDHSGTLSAEEILGIPEFSMNPLAPRIIELLNVEDEELDFAKFTELLSVFHPQAQPLERLELVFQAFNVSNDGLLKRTDLLQIMKLMAGPNLEDDELQLMVNQTMHILDRNQDGVVDFNEFVATMASSNVLNNMAIAF